jgi:hypothetical protein
MIILLVHYLTSAVLKKMHILNVFLCLLDLSEEWKQLYVVCLFLGLYLHCTSISNKILCVFHFRLHYNGIIPMHNSPSVSGLSSSGEQNGCVSPGISVMTHQTPRDILHSSNNNNNNNNNNSNSSSNTR